MIGNALKSAVDIVESAYFRWMDNMMQQAEGSASTSYVQGIQNLLRGDFRADEEVVSLAS